MPSLGTLVSPLFPPSIGSKIFYIDKTGKTLPSIIYATNMEDWYEWDKSIFLEIRALPGYHRYGIDLLVDVGEYYQIVKNVAHNFARLTIVENTWIWDENNPAYGKYWNRCVI